MFVFCNAAASCPEVATEAEKGGGGGAAGLVLSMKIWPSQPAVSEANAKKHAATAFIPREPTSAG